MIRHILDKTAADRGFTGAHLAGDDNKATLALNPVHKMCQRFFVAVAQIEIPGVGGNRKRGFTKTEELVVHLRPFRNGNQKSSSMRSSSLPLAKGSLRVRPSLIR